MTKKNASMPCVLLTGFNLFAGETINASWQAVNLLDDTLIAKHRIVAIALPCEFNRSLAVLLNAIEQHHPALVLCVGQAGGRSEINIERVAINIDDARIADNAGKQPIDCPVIADAPAAYFSNLPIKRMLIDLQQSHIPAAISNSAGTYVCNHVMYGLLHHIALHEPQLKAGFVHIPYLPSQAVHHSGSASMSEETVNNALKVLITTALTAKQDVKVAAGTTH
ncbi:pyroglutamyl-peptidase I [Pseudoalteromonas mariniglutinosa]|uniref:pyroglutamyl-peptidase I n=1 Tax=Pseudoalteromonas mariniglutinosa TaxID=206042 RepID=UPI003850EC52